MTSKKIAGPVKAATKAAISQVKDSKQGDAATSFQFSLTSLDHQATKFKAARSRENKKTKDTQDRDIDCRAQERDFRKPKVTQELATSYQVAVRNSSKDGPDGLHHPGWLPSKSRSRRHMVRKVSSKIQALSTAHAGVRAGPGNDPTDQDIILLASDTVGSITQDKPTQGILEVSKPAELAEDLSQHHTSPLFSATPIHHIVELLLDPMGARNLPRFGTGLGRRYSVNDVDRREAELLLFPKDFALDTWGSGLGESAFADGSASTYTVSTSSPLPPPCDAAKGESYATEPHLEVEDLHPLGPSLYLHNTAMDPTDQYSKGQAVEMSDPIDCILKSLQSTGYYVASQVDCGLEFDKVPTSMTDPAIVYSQPSATETLAAGSRNRAAAPVLLRDPGIVSCNSTMTKSQKELTGKEQYRTSRPSETEFELFLRDKVSASLTGSLTIDGEVSAAHGSICGNTTCSTTQFELVIHDRLTQCLAPSRSAKVETLAQESNFLHA
ncbi:uncharacterized protein BDR25DRAFT_320258 [Lindgomyces ingoldianus]|uniref:Uncharacterized protein n=1 Tax=Lindgomyces ingoldianus TaxID=673940 RepID=A0ACB6Q885_9PLEO|nr:uncharacterized protein BDR25DRAFT_320258 [Lindgomyces ingoldianus]KAF2463065.1 hypothetical protein BDR25DRAFT_320258 [Lindgomyces ingoldianus]